MGTAAILRQPATYFHDNLLIGIQLLDAAARRSVAKLVAIGSACDHPKLAPILFTNRTSGTRIQRKPTRHTFGPWRTLALYVQRRVSGCALMNMGSGSASPTYVNYRV